MAAGRMVIVGGGGAGDTAAFNLREEGFDGEIVVIGADPDRAYDRPYLSKEFLRGEIDAPKVYLHEEADYGRARIDLRPGLRVTAGSAGERRLELSDGSQVDYETLLLATGGTPRWLPEVPRASNVFTLRSLADGRALRDALRGSARVLLIGAGFIGAEVAASARALGKEVVLVEAAPVPLGRALGEAVGQVYASIHSSHGVDVRTGTRVTDWHQSGDRVSAVTLDDGSRQEVEIVVLGAGIEPNLEVATALGLATEAGGVVVDAGLRAAPGIYVAGDIAYHAHPVLGRALRVEHWEVAKGHGAGVAKSVASGHQPYTTLPYFWSDQYDVSLEYRGQASGEHEQVWRGDRAGLKFSVFYLREGVVDAVLSMNDGPTNEAAEPLIQKRLRVNADALADPGTDIRALAGAPVQSAAPSS